MSRARNHWVLPVSVIVALLLGLLPLPAPLQPLRPYWLALVVAYWVIEDPDRAGLGFAFALGLLADLAFGGLLGEQALRLVVMAFILQRFRAQLRFFPLSQQALAIGGLLLNDRVVSAAVHIALGEPQLPWSFWWAPLLGMLLWAPLFLLLDALRLGRSVALTRWVRAVASSSIPRRGRAVPRARRDRLPRACCWRWAGWRCGTSSCRCSTTPSTPRARRPTGSSRGRWCPGAG